MDAEKRVEELGIELPASSPAKAMYIPAKRVGSTLYVSGQIPILGGEMPLRGRTCASSLPSLSKHTVTIRYVPSLSMVKAPSAHSGEGVGGEDGESSAEKPTPPLRCICSWSTAYPR